MKYGILLWPHSNNRYQDAIRPLSQRELLLLMGADHLSAEASFERIAGAEFLCFTSDLGPELVCAKLRDAAHLFLLSEIRQDGSLMPLMGQKEAYLGADLPGILKYKGKTNEMFTRFLINMALYSSAFFDRADERLKLFDPMCGRGTALFEAVNRGWDAFGADISRQDIHEAEVFFRRYLEYHRVKHLSKDLSMTLTGRRAIVRKQTRFGVSPEAFKAGDISELSLINADALDAARAFPEKSFHVTAIDLPYGVQHDSGAKGKPEPLEQLLRRVLPELRERLLPGGAIALSFNVHTMKRDKLRQLLSESRFTVMEGGLYDGLEHWVEQAVTRDLVVGVRKKG